MAWVPLVATGVPSSRTLRAPGADQLSTAFSPRKISAGATLKTIGASVGVGVAVRRGVPVTVRVAVRVVVRVAVALAVALAVAVRVRAGVAVRVRAGVGVRVAVPALAVVVGVGLLDGATVWPGESGVPG